MNRLLPSLLRRLRLLPPLLLLAAGGAALLPLSTSLNRRQLEAQLRYPPVQIKGQDALSQQLALFTLGGLRTLASEILVLDTTDAWLKHDWPRAARRWQDITTLSPKHAGYWADAAREMANNAAQHVLRDPRYDRQQRAILAREYRDRGERFLRDGLQNNPDDPELLLELARYCGKTAVPPRHSEAAELYARAVQCGAPKRFERWQLYELCQVRNRKEESLKLAQRLFANPDHISPSLCCILFDLQEELRLPESEKLSLEEIFGSRQAGIRELNSYIDNDLGYPTEGARAWLREHAKEETRGEHAKADSSQAGSPESGSPQAAPSQEASAAEEAGEKEF